jgi:hypothetical protein
MKANYSRLIETRKIELQGKVGFAVGTGRCGTEFMARVASLEPHVASVHERNALNETFHRYCKWYDLPVDDEGFLHTKEIEIRQDLRKYSYSFESSAHLSLSVQELYENFGSKFVLLVRRPEQVVKSFILFKDLYNAPIVRRDPDLAVGYQECKHFHHFLGRFVPSGEKFFQWVEMTQVGRVAWYWNALNARVLEEFSGIPETHWCVVKLEELDYACYVDVAGFLGYNPTISQLDYDALVKRRPNASHGLPRTIDSWTPQERAEFEAEVMPVAVRLGYEYRVEKLPPSKPVMPSSFFERLRGYFVR